MDIQKDLQDIFRDIFDDDSLTITRNTSAKDIEAWDSLAQMNIIVAIQKHFKIRFKVSEIVGLQNVGDLIDKIESHMKG